MWQGPFTTFPRQLGFPSRACIVYNMTEFLAKVNKYNCKTKDVFTTLYSFDSIIETAPDYSSARIQHLFFDLDNGNCLESMNKLHEYLRQQDLQHCMFFSGGGFHCYVETDYPNNLKDKKSAIFNAVMQIADNLQFKAGIDEHSDLDAHTIGNIAQLVRVPNTYNLKRKRFCIPIYHKDLKLNLEEIYKLASSQRTPLVIYGSKQINLESYDREPIEKYRTPAIETGDSIGIEQINIETFPPCIRKLLTAKFIKHKHRFYLISYFKEIGLPLRDCILLLQKYLDSRTYNHCVHEERQPVFVYRRSDLGFPSCERLKKDDLCVDSENCRRRN